MSDLTFAPQRRPAPIPVNALLPWAVVGGLILSQLLTLYITPVLYVYLDNLGHRFGRRGPQPAHAPAE